MLVKETLYTLQWRSVLENPLLNKGPRFYRGERTAFNLQGLLRIMLKLSKNRRSARGSSSVNLSAIFPDISICGIFQDTNETLFYHLLRRHMKEMLPVIYTPTVGEACEHFSEIYRRGRGLFISGLTGITLTRCRRASPATIFR